MTAPAPSSLRFFAVVQPPSFVAAGAGVAILAFGVFTAFTAPGDASTVDVMMALALLLQMFLASSGFRHRCLRGHFDSLLVAGGSRWKVAAAHWLVSTAPGLTIWLAVIVLALWVRSGEWPAPATAPAVLAVFFVSTVAWATSLPTVQYAAGSAWILALIVLAATHHLTALRSVFYQPGWASSVRASGAALMCPIVLLSEAPAVGPAVVAELLVVTIAAGAIGALYIVRFDARLTEVA